MLLLSAWESAYSIVVHLFLYADIFSSGTYQHILNCPWRSHPRHGFDTAKQLLVEVSACSSDQGFDLTSADILQNVQAEPTAELLLLTVRLEDVARDFKPHYTLEMLLFQWL